MGKSCNITPLLRIESQNRSGVHVMLSDFIMSVIEIVVHSIVFALFFCLVVRGVWFLDSDVHRALVGVARRAHDGWGELGRRVVGGSEVDVLPLSRSLLRQVIVLARLSSAASVVVDVVIGVIGGRRTFGMQGVLSSSRGIGKGRGFSFLPINVCVGLGFFDWVIRVVRQISENGG